MIVVVADDFTGAAELCGIGLRYGLKVELETEIIDQTDADLLVIATDTRSMDSHKAVRIIKDLSEKIIVLQPEFVYKKIDSVLRGHVLDEIQVMMRLLNMKSSIIVPVNPRLERVIINSKYYINGIPLENTSFAEDPEFNIHTSDVKELLTRNNSCIDIVIKKPEQCSHIEGIVIGEAASMDDLFLWAGKWSCDCLPVGAAEFFQAILDFKGKTAVTLNNEIFMLPERNALFICGSAFSASRNLVMEAERKGHPVSYMPDEIFWNKAGKEKALQDWIQDVISKINKYRKSIISVRQNVISSPVVSKQIKSDIAVLVKEVLSSTNIEELIIEGGGTASAILGLLGFKCFVPLHQFRQGVIRMSIKDAPGLFLTMKPGSYAWPESVWNFN